MRFDFGDVVLVRFPFTNQAAFKQRPAIVVSKRSYNESRPDLVLMAVTSQLRASASVGEVRITEWQAAGLLKPSSVKPVFATVEQGLIIKQLGALRSADADALHDAINSVMGK